MFVGSVTAPAAAGLLSVQPAPPAELSVSLPTGAEIQLFGADNPDALRAARPGATASASRKMMTKHKGKHA